VVASESANNAGIGGAMIPLLTLGIPGDGDPARRADDPRHPAGPMLFVTRSPLVCTIFAGVVRWAFMMLILEFSGLRIVIKLLAIPKHVLLPVILVICTVGALGPARPDIWTILGFGVLGYAFGQGRDPDRALHHRLHPRADGEDQLPAGAPALGGGRAGVPDHHDARAFLGLATLSIAWQFYATLRPGPGRSPMRSARRPRTASGPPGEREERR
jgi:putative tricarboxylic transport membrane protein